MEFSFLFNNRKLHRIASELVQVDSCDFQLSSKFRTYYRFLRPIMPVSLRQQLQRRQSRHPDDRWYEPVEFMRSILECFDSESLTTIHPWPGGSKYAFVLTHDVETSEGMRHISRIADLEESLGFRSSWNLVPFKYKIDSGLVNDLQSRGFEIGIHGYNHDGQLYSSRSVFEYRATAINEAIKKFGAVGFRSPMVHRNLNWLQLLDIEYDSSCFDIDPYQPAPGGVGSIWPFIAGRFVELPYTLPQDHTLFVTLRERDDSIWKAKLDYIVRHQGMALMLTHPDYMTRRREFDVYFRFLQYVKDLGTYWHANAMDVARWWREREQAVKLGLSVNNSSGSHDRSVIANIKLNGDDLRFICS